MGVAEPPACARLGLHQARLAVAAVGPLPSFLSREPPRISAMASPPSNLQVSLFSLLQESPTRGAARGGGWGGGRKRPRPWCGAEEGGALAQPLVGKPSVFPLLSGCPKPIGFMRLLTFAEASFFSSNQPRLNHTGQSCEQMLQCEGAWKERNVVQGSGPVENRVLDPSFSSWYSRALLFELAGE